MHVGGLQVGNSYNIQCNFGVQLLCKYVSYAYSFGVFFWRWKSIIIWNERAKYQTTRPARRQKEFLHPVFIWCHNQLGKGKESSYLDKNTKGKQWKTHHVMMMRRVLHLDWSQGRGKSGSLRGVDGKTIERRGKVEKTSWWWRREKHNKYTKIPSPLPCRKKVTHICKERISYCK